MSIQAIQKKIGAVPDGVFGKQTMLMYAKHYGISELRAVHFFAQCAHETAMFTAFEENLNYHASGLRKVFKRYFDEQAAQEYARQPERIANRAYANRMGNGDEASGDGWRFRGRGAIHLTGRANYEAFSKAICQPLVMENPDVVASDFAFDSAAFFFDTNKVWRLCDEGTGWNTVKRVTQRVNGGTNGLQHRFDLTKKYASLIGLTV